MKNNLNLKTLWFEPHKGRSKADLEACKYIPQWVTDEATFGGQRTIWNSDVDFLILDAGRRWGKTATATAKIVDTVINHHKRMVGVGAPKDPLCDLIWKMLLGEAPNDYPMLPPHWIESVTKSKGNRQIKIKQKRRSDGKMIGGGIIKLYSLHRQTKEIKEEASSTLGEGFDLIVIDEAPLVSPDMVGMFLPALLSGGGRKGKGIFIGTPRGQTWIANRIEKIKEAKRDGRPTRWGYFKRSSFDNNTIPIADIWDMMETVIDLKGEEYAAQEFLARCVTAEGEVFSRIDANARNNILEPYMPGYSYLIAVDLATGKGSDYTVIAVARIQGDTVKIVHFRRFRRHINETERQIKEVFRLYKSTVYVDGIGMGFVVAKNLREIGTPIIEIALAGKGDHSKEKLVQDLASYMASGRFLYPNNSYIKAELQQYRGVTTSSGYTKYSAPSGKHDDVISAFLLIMDAIKNYQIPRGHSFSWKKQITR